MKPMNFPERKRQRQLSALERLEKAKTPERRDYESAIEYGVRLREWLDPRDYDTRVLSEAVAASKRDVRTKKYRGTGREYER